MVLLFGMVYSPYGRTSDSMSMRPRAFGKSSACIMFRLNACTSHCALNPVKCERSRNSMCPWVQVCRALHYRAGRVPGNVLLALTRVTSPGEAGTLLSAPLQTSKFENPFHIPWSPNPRCQWNDLIPRDRFCGCRFGCRTSLCRGEVSLQQTSVP